MDPVPLGLMVVVAALCALLGRLLAALRPGLASCLRRLPAPPRELWVYAVFLIVVPAAALLLTLVVWPALAGL